MAADLVNTTDMLLTTKEAAELLRLKPRTLDNWRSAGVGPKHIRIGKRTIRYTEEDLREWIRQNQSTDEK